MVSGQVEKITQSEQRKSNEQEAHLPAEIRNVLTKKKHKGIKITGNGLSESNTRKVKGGSSEKNNQGKGEA